KRIEPPHNERNIQVKMMTEGMEMIIVVVWKNVAIRMPMPVIYIWCAQTMNDRNPIVIAEYTSDLYPQIGLRVLLAMISATIPIAGRMSTYTSGWPRNQNKCCHSNGLPPPLFCANVPTARPVGRKKLVCATLSINCMMPAASSGGNASNSRKAVTNCDQTKNGMRIQVMPGARNWMMVAMKFT